jgi:hypothetical protein
VMKLFRRGQVGSVGPMALTLVVAVLVVGIGSLIIQGISNVGTVTFFNPNTNNTYFNTTINAGQTTASTIASFLPLVGLAVIAAIIIGLFLGFMGRK